MSSGLVTVIFAADESAAVQRHLKRALEAAQEMKEGDTKECALGAIGLIMAHSGDIAGAQAVVGRIKSPDEAASVLAAIGLVQAKQGDRDGAKATLAEAVRRAVHRHGIHLPLLTAICDIEGLGLHAAEASTLLTCA